MNSILQTLSLSTLRAKIKDFLLPHNFLESYIKWQYPRNLSVLLLGCVCETHNRQWEICIYSQKPPYIAMEPFLQQCYQRHIQKYVSWSMKQHKPGNSTTGMILLSLLRMQDNIILPKWYEYTSGICFDCPDDGDLHIPSEPTWSHFYLRVEVPG